jgi:hypothetical protein
VEAMSLVISYKRRYSFSHSQKNLQSRFFIKFAFQEILQKLIKHMHHASSLKDVSPHIQLAEGLFLFGGSLQLGTAHWLLHWCRRHLARPLPQIRRLVFLFAFLLLRLGVLVEQEGLHFNALPLLPCKQTTASALLAH